MAATIENTIKDALLLVLDANLRSTNAVPDVVGTGNGVLLTFTHALVHAVNVVPDTVRITDTVEDFNDVPLYGDNLGKLVGSRGGFGTINYDTGAISITFKDPPLLGQAITANHRCGEFSIIDKEISTFGFNMRFLDSKTSQKYICNISIRKSDTVQDI